MITLRPYKACTVELLQTARTYSNGISVISKLDLLPTIVDARKARPCSPPYLDSAEDNPPQITIFANDTQHTPVRTSAPIIWVAPARVTSPPAVFFHSAYQEGLHQGLISHTSLQGGCGRLLPLFTKATCYRATCFCYSGGIQNSQVFAASDVSYRVRSLPTTDGKASSRGYFVLHRVILPTRGFMLEWLSTAGHMNGE